MQEQTAAYYTTESDFILVLQAQVRFVHIWFSLRFNGPDEQSNRSSQPQFG